MATSKRLKSKGNLKCLSAGQTWKQQRRRQQEQEGWWARQRWRAPPTPSGPECAHGFRCFPGSPGWFFTSNWVWYSSEVEWSQISSNGVKLDKYVSKPCFPKKGIDLCWAGTRVLTERAAGNEVYQRRQTSVQLVQTPGYNVFEQFWFCFKYERWPGLSNNQFFKVMMPGNKTVSKFLNCEELRIFELKSSTFPSGWCAAPLCWLLQ